jgi:phosphate transport system protein
MNEDTREASGRPDKFHQNLEALRGKLMALAGLVQTALSRSIAAFWERDPALARSVIKGDAPINDLEVDIDEDCIRLVALYQPVAVDLRVIMAVDHIIAELERIGDLAVNMAEEALELTGLASEAQHPQVLIMARKVQEMVSQSLEAFKNRDAALARRVCADDDEVDALDRSLTRELLQNLAASREVAPADQSQVNIVRHLERVGDHATNIAEQAVYMVEGKNVRHRCQG